MVLSRGLVRKARVGIMDYLFSYRRLRYEQCTGTVGTEIEFVRVSVSSLVDLSLDLSPLAFVSGQ